MKRRSHLLTLSILACLIVCSPSLAADLKLDKGDHIALIGNLLAERMQHDGWLEAEFQTRLPEHELVFRNLGFSGDEIDRRQRSQNFGSPDEWLKRVKADVVFAMFGFGESFAGDEGIDNFKKKLTSLVENMRKQKYNGNEPPQVVLVSPIAFEDLNSANLPDGEKRNEQLAKYTEAMAEVAQQQDVPFVDLFHPTQEAYKNSSDPLTLNGHFLTDEGNRVIAEVIADKLLEQKQADKDLVSEVRDAVVDKNFYWFNRYRTTDGYNVYGGRSQKRYTDKISNFEVMQREMEILDVKTANRDRRVWAVAQGSDLNVDDSNTPDPIPVKTNKPGPNPDGSHQFLGGKEAIEKMKVADGMEVSLVASEEQFPELINPVQMAFDVQGRLWVATWPSYPHWHPNEEMNDRLLILEDTDGDGKADKCKTFAAGLHNPTGFEFWNGGVVVSMAPDLIYLKDTDGDDKADVRIRMLHGIDSADTHHTANSFVLGPDGALYFQEGTFHQSQIESVEGVVRNNNGCVWRFEPRTWRVDRYVPYNFANPHGHVFDRWGNDFIHDGTNANPYHSTLFNGYVQFPRKHGKTPMLYNRRTRPCPATEILSSDHFPEEMQGDLLVQNVIGFQGILRYDIEEKGSSYTGVEADPILHSSDQNFRPVDLEVGPDGALYFVDWHNPIIGHLQHHIRDPNRNKTHGRVYRVTYKGRDLLDPPKVAGEPIPKLLDLLKKPQDRLRYRVRIELSGRSTSEVMAATKAWLDKLDKNDPDYEHHRLEALWLHQQHNVVNAELLKQVLNSPDHRARTAAVRVLSYWNDRVDGALDLLAERVNDEHPRVRLEAVRAASFFDDPAVIEVVLQTLQHPQDEYLKHTLDVTMKTLDKYLKQGN